MNEKTVVLLHGAGTGAWIWDRVMPHINASSIALDIPSRSRDATPESCASWIVKEIDDRGIDRVVLVMHSLAGVLAADIATRLGERLTKCVYIAAVIPADRSTFARAIGFPGRILLPILFSIRPGGLLPSEAMIRKELCGDLHEEDCARVVNLYEAEFPGLYLSRVAGPPECHSVYLRLLNDASVLPPQQSGMIRRLATPTVFEIASGHLVMLSHPEELAGIMNSIVESA